MMERYGNGIAVLLVWVSILLSLHLLRLRFRRMHAMQMMREFYTFRAARPRNAAELYPEIWLEKSPMRPEDVLA